MNEKSNLLYYYSTPKAVLAGKFLFTGKLVQIPGTDTYIQWDFLDQWNLPPSNIRDKYIGAEERDSKWDIYFFSGFVIKKKTKINVVRIIIDNKILVTSFMTKSFMTLYRTKL